MGTPDVSPDAHVPSSDVSEKTNALNNVRSNDSGQMVEIASQLEALNTTEVSGRYHIEAKDMQDNTDIVYVNLGSQTANGADEDPKVMMAEFAKMLANAHSTANTNGGMRETAERIASDKDSSSVHLLCIMCQRPGPNFCNGCQQARYCSAACQRADWPIHKQLCKAFAKDVSQSINQDVVEDADQDTIKETEPEPESGSGDRRPSPSHRQALYLSFETNKMDLIWVDCCELPEDTQLIKRDSIKHPDLKKFTSTTRRIHQYVDRGPIYTFMNLAPALLGSRVPHALLGYSLIDENAIKDLIHPTMINQTINGLAKPGHLSLWFGPLVVFVCDPGDGEDSSGRAIKDITPRDVRHAVDFFTNNHNNPCIPYPDRFPHVGELVEQDQNRVQPDETSDGKACAKKSKSKKKKNKKSSSSPVAPKLLLPGVKISDTQERYNKALGVTNVIESVTVPFIAYGEPSWGVTMAFRLGLRWYLRRASPVSAKSNPFIRDSKTDKLFPRWHTGDVRWLGHTTLIEPDGRTYTSAADQHVGSVVVFHGRGGPIDPLHIIAFNKYLDSVYIAKQTTTPEGFDKYWAAMKMDAEKKDGGEFGLPKRIARLPSPYKMEDKEYRADPDWFCENPAEIEQAAKADGVWEEVVREFGKTSAGLLSLFSKVGKKKVGNL